jgi:hypothetical protein
MEDPQEIQLEYKYWGFSPRAFDGFTRDLERRSDGGWRYSAKVSRGRERHPHQPRAQSRFFGDRVWPAYRTRPCRATRTLAQAIERLSDTMNEPVSYILLHRHTYIIKSLPSSSSVASKINGVVTSKRIMRHLERKVMVCANFHRATTQAAYLFAHPRTLTSLGEQRLQGGVLAAKASAPLWYAPTGIGETPVSRPNDANVSNVAR